jgi:hypothetical protein
LKRLNKKSSLILALLPLLSALLPAQELEAEIILKSFRHAFPHKVQEAAFIEGDWTILVGSERFYWSQGRLLPQSLKSGWESYKAHNFFQYPKNIPDPANYSQEQIAAFRLQALRDDSEEPYLGFQGALYGGLERIEIENHQVKMVFLGKNIVIHKDIVEALERIERNIMKIAQEDREIAEFTGSIASIGGYNWRSIQGTRRMSYHSWGLALDIQPKQLNKVMYWFWERIHNPNWLLVPLENRWNPPQKVIQLFENEGFIWGGKWALYDNMHFEYRPEFLEANRLLAPQAPDSPPAQNAGAPVLHHVYPSTILPNIPFWERLLMYFGLRP